MQDPKNPINAEEIDAKLKMMSEMRGSEPAESMRSTFASVEAKKEEIHAKIGEIYVNSIKDAAPEQKPEKEFPAKQWRLMDQAQDSYSEGNKYSLEFRVDRSVDEWIKYATVSRITPKMLSWKIVAPEYAKSSVSVFRGKAATLKAAYMAAIATKA